MSVTHRTTERVNTQNTSQCFGKTACDAWQRVTEHASSVYQAHPIATIAVSATAVLAGACAFKGMLSRCLSEPNEWQKKVPSDKPTSVTTNSGENVVVRRLNNNKKDVRGSGALMALWLARSQDPMARACAAKTLTDAQYGQALKWLYTCVVKTMAPSHTGSIAFTDEDQKSVAIWLPPGVQFSESDFLKNGGYAFVWKFSGWERRMRFLGYGDVISRRRWRLMRPYNQRYFYLFTLGTLEADLNNSSTEAVVRAGLTLADESDLPCIVETSRASDISFYNKLGFETVEEFAIFGVTVKILIRAPASHRR